MKSAQERAEKAAKELIDGKDPAVDIGDYSNGAYDEELAAQTILRETNLPALVKCAKALDQIVNSEPGAEDWCSARQTLKELNQNDK